MASSPIRRPTADPPSHRSKSAAVNRSRHFSIQSSPGPSARGLSIFGRSPFLSSPFGPSPLRSLGHWSSDRESAIDPEEFAAVKKKQKWRFEGHLEKWRDAESDGEEVDLRTMTVHRSDGTVAEYNPLDPEETDEEEAENEGDVSVSESSEDDSDHDVLGDWTEQEEANVREEEVRRQARTAQMRSQDPFFASDPGDQDELLELFMRDEERRKAKSRERSLSAHPVLEQDEEDSDREPEDPDVDMDDDSPAEESEPAADESEAPMSSKEIQAVLARSKEVRLADGASYLDPAYVRVGSPPPIHLSPSAHGPLPSRPSEAPRRSFWQRRSPETTEGASDRKGKARMYGERASDPADAKPPATERMSASSVKPVRQPMSAKKALHTPKTPVSATHDLDPYYYRTSTYKFTNANGSRTCRLCRRAGGTRAKLAAHCRGCVSFKECRFPRDTTDSAHDTGADSAIDADLDETPTMKSRNKVKIKRRSKLQTVFTAPRPASQPAELDPLMYYHKLCESPAKDAYRSCPLCRRATGEDGQMRRQWAEYCRGRISGSKCKFEGHKAPLRHSKLKSAVTPSDGRRRERPSSEPTTPFAVSSDTDNASPARPSKVRRDVDEHPDAKVSGHALDSKLYYHSLLKAPVGEGYRQCPICARADGQQRRLAFWCRGRISFRECGFFDGNEEAYLAVRRGRHRRHSKVRDVHAPASSQQKPRSSATIANREKAEASAPDSDLEPPAIIPSVEAKRSTMANKTNSPYHAKLHMLYNGGCLHCKLCRAAGGQRAELSGYCKGRMGGRLCAFEDKPDYFVSRAWNRRSSDAPNNNIAQPRIETEIVASMAVPKVTGKRSREQSQHAESILSAPGLSGSGRLPDPLAAVFAAVSRSNPAGRRDGTSAPPSLRKVARPRPKTPARSDPLSRHDAVPRKRASTAFSAELSHETREPTFDVIIPVMPRSSKTPDTLSRMSQRVPVTPISPEIRPQHLDFGRPLPRAVGANEDSDAFGSSPPLPPSSPPVELPVRTIRPMPTSVRPTPPDSSRERSTATPSGRDPALWKQPIKSSLRQSSEMSDAPRSVKRARFSMPLSPSSDRGQGQAPSRFQILQPRSSSPSEQGSPEPQLDDSDSSDDDGFLLVPPCAKGRSSSVRPSSQFKPELWSSSPFPNQARPEWTPDGGRLPARFVARFTSAFEHQSPSASTHAPKRSLMLPPPIPARAHLASKSNNMPRSEPRPSHYKIDRVKTAGSTGRPRSKSLALQSGNQRDVPVLSGSRMISVGQ